MKCWHCGETKSIEVPTVPQFAFEVAQWAHDVGWLGAFDKERNRVLVFCCKEHELAERKKDGNFRLRAKGTALKKVKQ